MTAAQFVFYRGEVRHVGVQIARTDGDGFTITGATYAIRDPTRATVLMEGDATISGGAVYMHFNTLLPELGEYPRVFVDFTVDLQDSGQVLIDICEVHILE